MCGRHSAPHVAALVHQLPPDSRLGVLQDPDNAWSLEAVMLAAVFNDLQAWQWAQLDRKKRGPMPEKVGPSWMRQHGRKLDAQAMTIERLMQELSKNRREVQHG